MSQSLPTAAQRVQDFLLRQGSSAEVQLLPDSTATAHDAAATLTISVDQIGKSIVFKGDDRVVVVVICGSQRVDITALSMVIRSQAKLLNADEVKRLTGYAIGGVSPFALPSGVAVVVDSRLHKYQECFVAAGHPRAVVRTSGNELVALTGALVQTVALEK